MKSDNHSYHSDSEPESGDASPIALPKKSLSLMDMLCAGDNGAGSAELSGRQSPTFLGFKQMNFTSREPKDLTFSSHTSPLTKASSNHYESASKA